MRRIGQRFAPGYRWLLAVTLLLSGCIVVDDFGSYWDKGYVDACVNDILLADIAEDHSNTPPPAIRSLRLGAHTFAMVRDHPDDKGGELIRYNIINGEYVSYRLNEDKREDFLHYYPNSSVIITNETATIPVLDDNSASLLISVANDPSYWVEVRREPYNPKARPECIGNRQ